MPSTHCPLPTARCLLAAILLLAGCAEAADPPPAKEFAALVETLRPLHAPMGKPQPGDWLESHPESGQTFREYLAARPVTPRGTRNVIYVQPIGDFTAAQGKILDQTIAYLAICYNRPVKKLEPLALDAIPEKARRKHPSWGMEQILTGYVLNSVLRPKLPVDAAAAIALTSSDLWPGEGWNFVFGQASLRERVGVWSLYRNGDPEESEEAYLLCLRRTLQTAAHELGHMFTIAHCTAYECNMCGSNNREEADRRPLAECPECTAKICWATEADPGERFTKLAKFCAQNSLRAEQAFFEKSAAAVGKTTP